MPNQVTVAAHRNTVERFVGHACYACEGDGHYICELTGHRRACPVCMGTGVDDSDDPYEDETFDGLVPVPNNVLTVSGGREKTNAQ
jgi:DnaJ-class molecular chaperone